jgi:hypothetical protein
MSDPHITLPALLKRNAERYGDKRVAIREKEFGIWQSVTWQGYYENVRDFAWGCTSSASNAVTTLRMPGTTALRDYTPNWPFRRWGVPLSVSIRTVTWNR